MTAASLVLLLPRRPHSSCPPNFGGFITSKDRKLSPLELIFRHDCLIWAIPVAPSVAIASMPSTTWAPTRASSTTSSGLWWGDMWLQTWLLSVVKTGEKTILVKRPETKFHCRRKWTFLCIILMGINKMRQRSTLAARPKKWYLQDITNSSIWQKHWHHCHTSRGRSPTIDQWLHDFQHNIKQKPCKSLIFLLWEKGTLLVLVQNRHHQILHLQHHVHLQSYRNQDKAGRSEAGLNYVNFRPQKTSDLPVALQENNPELVLQRSTKIQSKKSKNKNYHWGRLTERRAKRGLPSISYFSVFFNAFMALDLSSKCTKPNLLFSWPSFAGGRTTFAIFPWCSNNLLRWSWVISFGKFFT